MKPSASNDLVVSALAEAIAQALTRQILPEIKQHLSDCIVAASASAPSCERIGDVRLSTAEAAARAHVQAKTVVAWIRSGKLPATRAAGTKQYLVVEAELEKFLAAGCPKKQGRSHIDEERVLRGLGL